MRLGTLIWIATGVVSLIRVGLEIAEARSRTRHSPLAKRVVVIALILLPIIGGGVRELTSNREVRIAWPAQTGQEAWECSPARVTSLVGSTSGGSDHAAALMFGVSNHAATLMRGSSRSGPVCWGSNLQHARV